MNRRIKLHMNMKSSLIIQRIRKSSVLSLSITYIHRVYPIGPPPCCAPARYQNYNSVGPDHVCRSELTGMCSYNWNPISQAFLVGDYGKHKHNLHNFNHTLHEYKKNAGAYA